MSSVSLFHERLLTLTVCFVFSSRLYHFCPRWLLMSTSESVSVSQLEYCIVEITSKRLRERATHTYAYTHLQEHTYTCARAVTHFCRCASRAADRSCLAARQRDRHTHFSECPRHHLKGTAPWRAQKPHACPYC